MSVPAHPGYTLTLDGVHRDGVESWSVFCACGWYERGRRTRDGALAAIRFHWQACPRAKP